MANVYTYLYIYISVYLSVYLAIYTYISVYVSISIYIHIHTYTIYLPVTIIQVSISIVSEEHYRGPGSHMGDTGTPKERSSSP